MKLARLFIKNGWFICGRVSLLQVDSICRNVPVAIIINAVNFNLFLDIIRKVENFSSKRGRTRGNLEQKLLNSKERNTIRREIMKRSKWHLHFPYEIVIKFKTVVFGPWIKLSFMSDIVELKCKSKHWSPFL